MQRITRGAFGAGGANTIAIAVINHARTPLGVDLGEMVKASQRFLDELFVPVWGTPAKLTAYSTARRVPASAWQIVFLDDADAANALGYHDLTVGGQPVSKVFVKDTIANGDKVSVTVCHELCEMLVDPAINLWAEAPDGSHHAYEMCDAVEGEEFAIDKIAMSDFVYPAYFEGFRKKGSAQFDYLKRVGRPFQILKGGYAIVQKNGHVGEVFGSIAKRIAFAREDRRLHRCEYRKPPRVLRPGRL